jgi:diacylglycerol kinase (ATP)
VRTDFLHLFSNTNPSTASQQKDQPVKLAVIANPRAGRGRTPSTIDAYRSISSLLGCEVSFHSTAGPGDATLLARRLKTDADVLAVIGGDGTVHEAVNGLMPDPIPIVICPAGSGNDLASVIRCPAGVHELGAMIREGLGARLDVVQIGDRYCVNSAGFGFEGLVNEKSHHSGPWKGPVLYLVAVLRTLSSLSCPFFDITVSDGTHIRGDKLLVSIGNGNRAGGAFHITPDATPDDGLADVCIVEAMKWFRVLRLLPKAIAGRHIGLAEVHMLRVPALTIETDPEFPMHIDGELVASAPRHVAITVRHRALPVICGVHTPSVLTRPLEKIL